MVQSVLAILDGGPGDAIVHETAVSLATFGKAAVSVLGLTDPRMKVSRQAVPAGALHYKEMADTRRYASLQADIAESAERLAAVCASLGVPAAAASAEGDPMACLSERWHRHDLLVMGRERRGEGTRLLSRRGLIRLLRECPKPVMVGCAARPKNPETVAIAYDGSAEAHRALSEFLNLGLARGRRLEVVCVQSDAARADYCANEAAQLCTAAGADYEVYTIPTQQHALWVLANRLVARKPALMVAASKGANTWGEFFFGSLPSRLLRGSGATLFLHP